MKQHNRTSRILTYTFLTISSFIVVYPALFMILGAFTTPARFATTLFLPIPNTLNLRFFISQFQGGAGQFETGLKQAYLVTLLRVAFYLVLNISTGLMAGYIFSKLRFPGRNKLFLLFLTGLVMPAILMILPDYILLVRFPLAGGNNILGQGGHGFSNEWPALILFGWVSPLAIFLFKQTYDMLPTEYEEAAKMDGANLFTIIFQVYLPLLKPALIALVILISVTMWNDYLWPSQAVISRYDLYPIAVRLIGLYEGGGSASPGAMARVLIAVTPPTVLFLFLQRYFVQGLVATGLKG